MWCSTPLNDMLCPALQAWQLRINPCQQRRPHLMKRSSGPAPASGATVQPRRSGAAAWPTASLAATSSCHMPGSSQRRASGDVQGKGWPSGTACSLRLAAVVTTGGCRGLGLLWGRAGARRGGNRGRGHTQGVHCLATPLYIVCSAPPDCERAGDAHASGIRAVELKSSGAVGCAAAVGHGGVAPGDCAWDGSIEADGPALPISSSMVSGSLSSTPLPCMRAQVGKSASTSKNRLAKTPASPCTRTAAGGLLCAPRKALRVSGTRLPTPQPHRDSELVAAAAEVGIGGSVVACSAAPLLLLPLIVQLQLGEAAVVGHVC